MRYSDTWLSTFLASATTLQSLNPETKTKIEWKRENGSISKSKINYNNNITIAFSSIPPSACSNSRSLQPLLRTWSKNFLSILFLSSIFSSSSFSFCFFRETVVTNLTTQSVNHRKFTHCNNAQFSLILYFLLWFFSLENLFRVL